MTHEHYSCAKAPDILTAVPLFEQLPMILLTNSSTLIMARPGVLKDLKEFVARIGP